MKYVKLIFSTIKSFFVRKPSFNSMNMDISQEQDSLPSVSIDISKFNYNRWRA